ncbi:MAG: hypothetical protein ACK5KR_06150 [Breznakia sp.]
MKDTMKAKVLVTTILCICLVFILYGIASVFVVGVAEKNRHDEANMIAQIQEKENNACELVERDVYQYVTYTCTTKTQYIVYDVEGTRLAFRDKKDVAFEEVESLIKKNYPLFKDENIHLVYGDDGLMYALKKADDFILIDFENLDIIHGSKGEPE